jgi:hypothetical protein
VGFLKHLLFWPVTGPTFLTRFSLEKVEGAVRSELTDDSAVKRDLMELQLQLELGDIDETEYAARETELMARLRDVRDRREAYGMATSGGLVRVTSEEEESGEPDAGAPRVAGSGGAEVDVSLGFGEG